MLISARPCSRLRLPCPRPHIRPRSHHDGQPLGQHYKPTSTTPVIHSVVLTRPPSPPYCTVPIFSNVSHRHSLTRKHLLRVSFNDIQAQRLHSGQCSPRQSCLTLHHLAARMSLTLSAIPGERDLGKEKEEMPACCHAVIYFSPDMLSSSYASLCIERSPASGYEMSCHACLCRG